MGSSGGFAETSLVQAALVVFHDALDDWMGPEVGHSRRGGWVELNDHDIVSALLASGWKTPD